MDLVEIRKKAKKLKDSKKESAKGGGEESSSAAKEEVAELKPEKKKGKAKTPEIPEDRKIAPGAGEAEPEEDAVAYNVFSAISAGDAAGDDESEFFISSVMDALYQEGYEEKGEEEEDRLELLCFMLSDEEYAVDINDVKEIIKVVEITEVPKTPDFMLGIISLRGVIIPLLDLRLRLDLAAGQFNSKTRIIVVNTEGASMGMVVDSVTEVVRLKKGVLESPPTLLANVNTDLLKGVGRHEDRLLIVPNLSKVFNIKDLA